MKKVKLRDERVVAESNRIYKIGFYVFTVGIALDMFIKACNQEPGAASADSFEWFVFLAAQFTCLVLFSRKGIYSEDVMAEAFNWKKHILSFSGAGLLCGVLVAARNVTVYNLQGNQAIVTALLTIVLICISVLVLCLLLARISFSWAKARREEQERELEGEER